MPGVENFHLAAALINLRGQGSDLGLERCLLRVHMCNLAGQHYAQPRAQFIAQRAIALGFGGLPLERTHLPGDFLENIVDAGEVLLGLLQAKLGQALFGFEAGNAGCLFDNRPAIMRFGAEQLPDTLLSDNRVRLRPQAGTHEDVLNVAEAAELAVEQVFAVSGAEEAAG